MDWNRFEIVIVANHHREPLICRHTKDIPHRVSMTPDYDLPADWQPKPEYRGLLWNATGAFRCFKGHQLALDSATRDIVLVLEDDAVPLSPEWVKIAWDAAELLNEREIVSLQIRNTNAEEWSERVIGQHTYLFPKKDTLWGQGSLAYLIKRSDAHKITSATFDGYPMDLILVNRFKYCSIKDSPFEHDRHQGSLVENPK